MALMNFDWEGIGQHFVREYYNIFDTQKEQLIMLYHPEAMLTFEDNKAQGREAIGKILAEKLTFGSIQHIVTKIDCQPTAERGVLILITGRLKTDNDPPHAFSQVIVLKPIEGNSFVIYHDVFRLSIHDSA